MGKIQVVGHTSFIGHTGYNSHSRNFFTHLNKYIPVRIRNYSYVKDLSHLKPEEKKLLIEQEWQDPPYKIGRPFQPNPKDTIVNLILNETNHYYFYDHYDHPMIAYNVWEATRQPFDYFNRVLDYDQFWCPTEWQRQCTIDQGYPADRVKVVPEGVNGKVFCPSSNTDSIRNKLYKKYNIPKDKFSFMLFGRWDYRKSITEVIQAFLEEFKNDDNVVLIASVDNPFSVDGLKTTEERLKHNKLESEKIKILHFPERNEYVEWIKSGHVFLCCPRSEGWNLPLIEAIASGTPSICSDWGAHLEFADGIAYKVNVPTEKSPNHVFNIKPNQDLGMWGEPDFDHLKKVMRTVYNEYSEAKQFAVKASKSIREQFSWDNAARTAETYIQKLVTNFKPIPKPVNKDFETSFEIKDGSPRVTFKSSVNFDDIILARVKDADGATSFETWFKNIDSNVNYWIALNRMVDNITFEVINKDNKCIYSETKKLNEVKNIIQENVNEMELYQDQYINGSVIVKGKRDCNPRYEAMKPVFEKYKRQFTILDIGANFGYYSIRAATEYDAISVMIENKDSEIKTLTNLCEQNDCKDKLIILQTGMNLHKLKELSKCEHFDVVLALNVIHHFENEEISEVCEVFTKLGDNLILETPPVEDTGACGQNNLKFIADYFSDKDGVKLGEFKRHTSNTTSEVIWFKTDRKILEWPYYEYEKLFERKDLDVEKLKNRGCGEAKTVVESDFKSKKLRNPRKKEVLDWIPGINLKTFINLNGVYPNIYDLIESLKTRNIHGAYKWDNSNKDIISHNFILNGCDLHIIDFDDNQAAGFGISGDQAQLECVIHELIKKASPKVSFVTSFFNVEAFIDELADSVLNQTFEDWEWIITDDWSEKDNTKKKLLELEKRDRRIKYVEQKFKQEVYWNPQKYASGELICWIGSDDKIVPKTLEIMVHFFDKNPNISCVHPSAKCYWNNFDESSYKHSSFCKFDGYKNMLEKHKIYLENKSGYERIGNVFGIIMMYRNPGPDFNFNDGDFKVGKGEDLARILRLEEMGNHLFLNRSLYKGRMREDSNTGKWRYTSGGPNDFDKMYKQANIRRATISAKKHISKYDSVREELYAFLYSKLSDERERKIISCLGFNLDEKDQELIKEIYFDHDIKFEDVDVEDDYVFIITRTLNDVEMYYEITSKLENAEIIFFFINDNWEPSFYDLEDSSDYFKLFKDSKSWLENKKTFRWTTYLYKYCSIIYNVKQTPMKLNLGCGNDIKEGYINIDKYNNTGNVDMKCDIGDLPFEDGSVDEIYTSHVFEHIPINEMYGVVEEWKRVLKLNGDLILRLPNLEHEVKMWLDTPDEDKWLKVSGIFGAQSHPGNTHFCGFNPGSLSAFIKTFDFEVITVGEKNLSTGKEIRLHAKKKESAKKTNVNYTCHFVDGPFIDIQGETTNNYFVVDFLDPGANATVHQQLLKVNRWTRPHRKYYTGWLVQVHRNGKLDFKHVFNLKNKNVLISFDTKGIGDTIAWIPYIEEFRNKHNCNVWISTFWNKLFQGHKNYSKLNFVHPGKVVENLYASYSVGCYDGDMNKNKINWRLLPLQKVCTDTLGLDYKEVVPELNFKNRGRRIKDKYVTISEHSTFACKYWHNLSGWQDIIDYLNELDLKVMVISKEKTKLKNIIDRTDRTIEESMNNIYHSEFLIGVSSGPAWLAWALKVPVIMISGYSKAIGEFHTGVERIINTNVCHGCFNRTDLAFDRGDWNWCPVHKGTPRQFECTKQITPEMVKEAINKIIRKN